MIKLGKLDYKSLWPNAKWAQLHNVVVGEAMTDPVTAQFILSHHNNRNRPLSESRARYISNVLSAGNWMLTGETMIFDWEDEVISAQHRLRGCVLSGASFPCLIVLGVDPKAGDWVDNGTSKTVGDRLSSAGYKNANVLAAVGRLVDGWVNLGRAKRQGKFDMGHMMNVLEKFPDVKDAASWAQGKCGHEAKFYGGTAILGFMYWIMEKAGTGLGEEFLTIAASNRIPQEARYNVVAKLNNQISSLKPGTMVEYISALTFKAWNAFRVNKVVSSLQYKDNEGYTKVYPWQYDKLGRPTQCGDFKIEREPDPVEEAATEA